MQKILHGLSDVFDIFVIDNILRNFRTPAP